MANAKISDITEDTSAADDDILYGTNATGTVDKRFSVLTIRGATLAPIGGHCTVATDDGVTTITVSVEDDDDLGGTTPSDLVLPTQGNVKTYVDTKHRHAEITSPFVVTQGATSDVLRDVTNLGLSVAANAVYRVELDGFYIAHASGDIKVGFTAPSGSTMIWTGIGVPSTVALSGAQGVTYRRHRTLSEQESFAGQGTAATDDLSFNCLGKLKTSSTAGTLQVQIAQVAVHASDTTLLAESTLYLTRVDTDG